MKQEEDRTSKLRKHQKIFSRFDPLDLHLCLQLFRRNIIMTGLQNFNHASINDSTKLAQSQLLQQTHLLEIYYNTI